MTTAVITRTMTKVTLETVGRSVQIRIHGNKSTFALGYAAIENVPFRTGEAALKDSTMIKMRATATKHAKFHKVPFIDMTA